MKARGSVAALARATSPRCTLLLPANLHRAITVGLPSREGLLPIAWITGSGKASRSFFAEPIQSRSASADIGSRDIPVSVYCQRRVRHPNWLAARAGRGTSEAKAAAARANGAKGGRPRKVG